MGLAKGDAVKKTPPLSDQTGVTFFYQKPKGEAFDISELFSDPFWQILPDEVLRMSLPLPESDHCHRR